MWLPSTPFCDNFMSFYQLPLNTPGGKAIRAKRLRPTPDRLHFAKKRTFVDARSGMCYWVNNIDPHKEHSFTYADWSLNEGMRIANVVTKSRNDNPGWVEVNLVLTCT
jgi:hypothetical protein